MCGARVQRPPVGYGAGFTLLELLVVLVLLGIILSFAMLSVGDGGRQDQLQREAQRLQALFHLAGEEAVLQSAELGVALRPNAYRFVRYGSEGWQGLGDAMFRDYVLPDGMELALYLEDMPVSLIATNDAAIEPQLLFLSSGERQPFELVIAYQDGLPLAYRLDAPPLGRITMQREVDSY